MSVLITCENCELMAEVLCECTSPPSFYCRDHMFNHMRVGGAHAFKESHISLSDEEVSILQQAAAEHYTKILQEIINRKNAIIDKYMAKIRKAEAECASAIELLSDTFDTKGIIQEICNRKLIPTVCDNSIIRAIVSAKHANYITKENLFREFSSLFDSMQNFPSLEWELYKSFSAHNACIKSLAISDCENYFATGGITSTIKIWKIKTGELIRKLKGHNDWVRSVSYLGNHIVSGSQDKTIKIWDGNKCICTLNGHTDRIYSVSVSSSKQYLASGGVDCTVILWNLGSKSIQNIFRGHSNSILSVCFSPNDKQIASSGDDRTIRIWNTDTGEVLNIIKGHSGPVSCVKYSGKFLVSSSFDRTIKIWNLSEDQPLRTLTGHTSFVVDIDVRENLIASLGKDNTIRMWNLQTGELIQIFEGHGDYSSYKTWFQMSVKILDAGNFIISGGEDGMAKIYRICN